MAAGSGDGASQGGSGLVRHCDLSGHPVRAPCMAMAEGRASGRVMPLGRGFYGLGTVGAARLRGMAMLIA